MSARELKEETADAERRIMQAYDEKRQPERNDLGDALSDETKQRMDRITKDDGA
jgi:predicted RNA-binding protein with PIN domain